MKNAIRLLVPAACLLAVAACSRTDRTDRDNMGRENTGTGSTTTTTGNNGTTAGNTGMGTGAGMGTGTTTGTTGTHVDNDHTVTGQTTVTGANVAKVGNDVAIRRLVESRCARETTCNNVGSGKKYASNDACMNNIRTDMKDDLNAKDCPHGIDQKELDECLQAIKNESCNNPIEKLSRITACRTSDLCMATADKNH